MLEPLEPEYAPGAKVVAELRNFTNADVQWGPSETAIGLERRTDGRWNALRTQPSEVGIKPLCVLPPGGHTGRASVCTFFTTLAPNEAPGTYRLKVTVFSNGPVEVTSGPFEVR